MDEAVVNDTETGRVVEGPGWFVLNAAEAGWERRSGFGVRCRFEADDARFPHFGVNVHVLMPGAPSGLYHSESTQEGFFVLDGECVAIVEGQERRLRRWDYLHCPPGTLHVLVGAGDMPCAILMIGAPRSSSLSEIHYPADAVAARHGASATHTTDSSKQAYADRAYRVTPASAPWPQSPSARSISS
jgi:uncharacterized cupin superfamily protein